MKYIIYILSIIIGCLLFSAFINSISVIPLDIFYLYKLLTIASVILFAVALNWLTQKIKVSEKIYVATVLLIGCFLRVLFVIYNQATPVSDFKLMFSAASNMNHGDLSLLKSSYFISAIYNVPFTCYQALLLKICDSIIILKVFNILFSLGIVYLMYLIPKKIDLELAKISILLTSIFLPFIIYTDVLTNQTISIFFILLGIYFLFTDVKYKLLLLGLFLGVGHIFRPVGTIFIIGVILYLATYAIINSKPVLQSIKHLIISVLQLIISFQLVVLIVSGGMLLFGASDHTLYYNPTPSYKFLVGLNHQTKGRYSNQDADLLFNSENFENDAQRIIKKRVEDKQQLLSLFVDKFKLMWSELDASAYWAGRNTTLLNTINAISWSLILFFSSVSCFFAVQQLNKVHLYSTIVLFGFFMIYCLIEIQTRYRYETYPLFIFLASIGVQRINNIFPDKK